MLISPSDIEISKLYYDGRFNGNKNSIDRLVEFVNNSDSLIARGYYSVILNRGLERNKSCLVIDRSKALSLMTEIFSNYQPTINDNSCVSLILGYAYEDGMVVEKNLNTAFHFYLQAANQDDCVVSAIAQYNVGLCYDDGKGVEINQQEAFRYFIMSAKQGHVNAHNAVAICYKNGKGVSVNHSEASRYFQMAIDQNNVYAQCNLGLFYTNGEGTPINYAKAFRYYKMAADQGHLNAQRRIAWCYFGGKGVTMNLSHAWRYSSMAADQGSIEALDAMLMRKAKHSKKLAAIQFASSIEAIVNIPDAVSACHSRL
jgi:TPR repeat protein